MKRLACHCLALLCVMLLCGCADRTADDPSDAGRDADALPHIVVMIADDLGLDWSPCQADASVDMPFLQSRCDRARVYTRAYAQPVCTPSRAAMMTGLHTPAHGASDVAQSAHKLSLSAQTLPEAARATGSPHRFSGFGKWHLSSDGEGGHAGPTAQGFDAHAGNPRQHHTYQYFTYDWYENGALTPRRDVYKTTRIVDASIAAFDEYHAGGPQFHWIGFVSPHIPYHVPPDDIHRVEGLPPAGTVWNATRDNPPPPGSFKLFKPSAEMVPPFRAMLQALDHEIERLVSHVEAASDRPVIFVFLGDNGTASEVFRRVPGSRGYRAKGSVYDGGTRVPLMIWSTDPALVPPGRDDGLRQLADLFPTLVSLSGGTPPPVDGRTLLPFGSAPPRSTAYLERGSDRNVAYAFAAVDAAGLKLILRETAREQLTGDGSVVELYDTERDPGEMDNRFPDGVCEAGRARVAALLDTVADANRGRRGGVFKEADFRLELDRALDACATDRP